MNAIYESLKRYYEHHGRIMPQELFLKKFERRYSANEMISALIAFNQYLDEQRSA